MFEFRRYRLPRAAASSRHCTAAARQRIAKERFQREGAADPARAHCPPQSEVPAGLDRRQHGHRAARLRPQRPADRLCASATHSAHAVGTMQQVVRGATGAPMAAARRRQLGTNAAARSGCTARSAHVMHCRVATATPSASARPTPSAQLLSSEPVAAPSSAWIISCSRRLGHVVAHGSAPGGRASRWTRARATTMSETTWSHEPCVTALQMTRGYPPLAVRHAE